VRNNHIGACLDWNKWSLLLWCIWLLIWCKRADTLYRCCLRSTAVRWFLSFEVEIPSVCKQTYHTDRQPFNGLFQDNLGRRAPERLKQTGFYWCKRTYHACAGTHTPILQPFFWDYLGEPVLKEIFWTFVVQGEITEAGTPTIRLGTTPSRLISSPLRSSLPIFTPDALPATTLPLYPGLGRHQICWLAYPVIWTHWTYHSDVSLQST